jgi:hypothetical protein
MVERSWVMEPEQVPSDIRVARTAPVPGRMVVTGLGQLAEVLVEYDEPGRSFQFVALGVPGIVSRSTDRTTVVSLGPNRCRVSLEIEMLLWGGFRILEPLLKRRIGSVLQPFLVDLKQFAEAPGAWPVQARGAGAEVGPSHWNESESPS